MTKLFYRSNNLTTIYVGTDWSTDAVTDSTDMFYVCPRLKGGAGTEYNSSFTDKTYAHIDGGTENPGYFTAYTYTLVHAKDATYTEAGNSEYYIGSDGRYYVLTDGGYVEIEENAWIIPMLEKTEVTIITVDINGNKTKSTVYAEIYTSADYTIPEGTYLDGYTFKGWKVNDTLYTTADEAQAAVESLVREKTAVTVAVNYEKLAPTYTVTVVGGKLKNGKTTGTYQPSVQLYAVASPTNDEEQKFSCWMVGNQIVGYDTTYAFRMPSSDMTLTAVYVNEEVETEKVGTGYIESVRRTDTNKLAFVSILSVPEGCKMRKAGVVVQSADTLNGAELTKENAKLVKFSDTSKNSYSSYKYTWTMSTTNHTKQWTVRPYLEYKDAKGTTQVIYGEAVTYCVNDVQQ